METTTSSYSNPWDGIRTRNYNVALYAFATLALLGLATSILIGLGVYQGFITGEANLVLKLGLILVLATAGFKMLMESTLDDFSDKAMGDTNIALWNNVEKNVIAKYGSGELGPYQNEKSKVFPSNGAGGFWGWLDRKFFGARTPVVWTAEGESTPEHKYLFVQPKTFEPIMKNRELPSK